MSFAYHISYEDLGDTVTLHPRVPETAAPGEDKMTPRISVCPRIADCFRLFAWKDYTDEVFVYVCDERVVMASAKDSIPDWEEGIKEEWWMKNPTRFKKLGKAKMFRPPMVMRKRFWTWTQKPEPEHLCPLYDDKFTMTPEEVKVWEDHEKNVQKIVEEMGQSLVKELEAKKK